MVSVSLLRPSWSSAKKQSGAFDLPSVLIGVAVVAILAIGVMATIFGVIPWAQDRAAKQDLAAMNTAQGTAYARDGSFTDKAALVGAGWIGEGTPAALDAKVDTEGKCYVAVTTSKTGNQFVISHDKPAPRELTSADTWCTGAPIIQDTSPVMITTWGTSLAETCKEITLPVTGLKGTVDWGDGTKNTETTHTFTASGPVTIRIDGTFTRWGSLTSTGWADAGCLTSVDRWGATGTTNLNYAFNKAVNLKHVESIPPTTANLSNAFQGVTSDFTIGTFDTSNVTDMSRMFYGAATFNQPVNFDTSKVTNMSFMFSDASVFNQPVTFNTSKVTTMVQMFYGAKTFDQPVNFDTSNVTTIYYMFYSASAFNQPVNFDTSNVTDMYGMFYGAAAFNQPVNFDTSSVKDLTSMFSGAKAFNQPVNFNTSNVTNMATMFYGAAAFDQPVNFDTSKVTTMYAMFSSASAFNQPVNFDTSKVTTMYAMFQLAAKFNQPLNFDTAQVSDMTGMFSNASSFNQDLSAWDTSNVTKYGQFSTSASWKLPKPIWVR